MIKSLFCKLIIFLIYKKIIINKALLINFKNIKKKSEIFLYISNFFKFINFKSIFQNLISSKEIDF